MAYLKGKKNPTYKRNGYKVVSGFRIYFEPHISSTSPYMIRLSGKGNIRKRFKTSEEAENFAQIKSIEVKNQGTQSLDFTEAMKKDYLQALEILKPFGITLTKCADYFAKHEAPLEYDTSIGVLVDSFIEYKKSSGVRPQTLLQYSKNLNDFKETFGKRNAPTISHLDLDKYLSAWDKSPTSQKARKVSINTFFNYVIEKGIIDSNPTSKVKLKTRLRNKKPPEIWECDDALHIINSAYQEYNKKLIDDYCPLDLYIYLAIGFLSGIRPQEIRRLKWKDIDLKKEKITIRPQVAKERKARVVTIQPSLLKHLKRFRSEIANDGNSYVICITKDVLRNRRNRLMKRLLKVWKQDAMRHTFATYHIAMFGVDSTRRILGHTVDRLMFEYYIGIAENSEADAQKYFGFEQPKKITKSTKA